MGWEGAACPNTQSHVAGLECRAEAWGEGDGSWEGFILKAELGLEGLRVCGDAITLAFQNACCDPSAEKWFAGRGGAQTDPSRGAATAG